jgi:hypothetical protein
MAFLLLKVADLVQNWKIRCMVWGEDELEDRLRRLIGSLHSYLEGSLGRWPQYTREADDIPEYWIQVPKRLAHLLSDASDCYDTVKPGNKWINLKRCCFHEKDPLAAQHFRSRFCCGSDEDISAVWCAAAHLNIWVFRDCWKTLWFVSLHRGRLMAAPDHRRQELGNMSRDVFSWSSVKKVLAGA